MKNVFVCSLCYRGLLGGGLFVDENTITFKTGKITVEDKYRNLCINIDNIEKIVFNWKVFPCYTFELKNTESYRFLIFNKKRFDEFCNNRNIVVE